MPLLKRTLTWDGPLVTSDVTRKKITRKITVKTAD
jgi:hypothetical protein